MRCLFFITVFLFSCSVYAQDKRIESIHAYSLANEKAILHDFISFLEVPNVATDTANIGKNAVLLARMMRERGIGNVQLLNADDLNTPPAVYGEVLVPGAAKTVVFYAHYDGQPVNPAVWAKGLHPFHPRILTGRLDENAAFKNFDSAVYPLPEDWRIYARGSSDDKGGVMAIITAFDAIRNATSKPQCNIKFFFEGEEEQGSTHLNQIIRRNRELLQSDLWIICDGPVHQSGLKQVVFGARGDTHLTLKVYGPKNSLHSGHYGNWVPNPVMILSKLLASFKDDKGRVTVRDFYSDVTPFTPLEKQALAKIPEVDAELKKKIGFASEEMQGVKLSEAINLPSLNINGIESANIGTISANVIPVSATAVIDLRLVLGNDWKKQQDKVIAHIRSQGFYVTDKEPTDSERSVYPKIVEVKRGGGNNAIRTGMDWAVAQTVVKAISENGTGKVLQVPTLGGSLPLDVIDAELHVKQLIVPIANYDNNQHAENENIRIKNFRQGIETMAALMLMKL